MALLAFFIAPSAVLGVHACAYAFIALVLYSIPVLMLLELRRTAYTRAETALLRGYTCVAAVSTGWVGAGLWYRFPVVGGVLTLAVPAGFILLAVRPARRPGSAHPAGSPAPDARSGPGQAIEPPDWSRRAGERPDTGAYNVFPNVASIDVTPRAGSPRSAG